MKDLALINEVSVVCPFCGGSAKFGESSKGAGIALHSIPVCPEYGRNDPLQFIAMVNRKLKIGGKGDA